MRAQKKSILGGVRDGEVCVLGLGYVGLTLAVTMADIGFKIVGVEVSDDVVENVMQKVTTPMWTAGTATTLAAFHTSSTQTGSTAGKYYYDVRAEDDQTKDVQFAISYGHRLGSGSEGSTTTGTTNPTKAIYSQLRQVLLPPQTTSFNFNGRGSGSHPSDDVFAIVCNRARYREKMDPGNWELHLASGSKRSAGDTSGSHFIKLIDDSGAGADPTIGNAKREFNVVSGSISTGTANIKTTAAAQSTVNSAGSLGYFFPELGVIVLNAFALSQGAPYPAITLTRSAAANDDTAKHVYNAVNTGVYFQARREEQIKSSHYFCRVKSEEYNWSQNPTYYTGSNAEIRNATFIQDPKSYITTVGLYNNTNELLAVAKLSQPLLKSRDREAVIKVRLDF